MTTLQALDFALVLLSLMSAGLQMNSYESRKDLMKVGSAIARMNVAFVYIMAQTIRDGAIPVMDAHLLIRTAWIALMAVECVNEGVVFYTRWLRKREFIRQARLQR